MKKIRKPSKILTGSYGAIVSFHVDYKMTNVWLENAPLDLGECKRLHKWLGQAIAYLEQQKRETKNG